MKPVFHFVYSRTILVFVIMSLILLTLMIMVFFVFLREYRYTYGTLKRMEPEKCEKEALLWTGFCVFAVICMGNFGTKGFIYANF